MSVKVFCKLADCVNWDNGLCSAEEIRIDRAEGYCATYEDILRKPSTSWICPRTWKT